MHFRNFIVINQRSSTRHDVEIPATLVVQGQERSAVIRNLSLGGAFVEYAETLPMGQRVKLSFRIATHDQPLAVDAEVRWSTSEGVGVQFAGLRAREVWSLNKFFEGLQAP